MNTINLEHLQTVTPVEFENLVNSLLIRMGFKASTTKASGDGGIDIIAVSEQPIVGGKYVIQCKRYSTGNNIGEPVIRELFGIMHAENANKGILITTADFSRQAICFAHGKAIELINGDSLVKLFNTYSSGAQDTKSRVDERESRIHRFLEQFSLSIEREKIRANRRVVELEEYKAFIHFEAPFHNELINIRDYYGGLFAELNNLILTGSNLCDDAKQQQADSASAMYDFLVESETNPHKVPFLSLLSEYSDKSLKLFKRLVGIDPPDIAINLHNACTQELISYLQIFGLLQEFLKENDEMIKRSYSGQILIVYCKEIGAVHWRSHYYFKLIYPQK